MPAPAALVARGLRKRYGRTQALDGLDLEIAAGTIRGLLGPNGAGKSTAVRCFATLTRYDEGEVSVAGHDARRFPREVRRSVGLVGHTRVLLGDRVSRSLGQESAPGWARVLVRCTLQVRCLVLRVAPPLRRPLIMPGDPVGPYGNGYTLAELGLGVAATRGEPLRDGRFTAN